MPVRVASAREAAAVDAAAVASGIPSSALMRVAAANAATVIAGRCGTMSSGVTIYTGPGNNGGDGWAVARSLAAAGVHVRVREVVESTSPDALRERDAFHARSGESGPDAGSTELGPGVIVDAILGTGATGQPRGAIAEAVRSINALHDRGALVVALDVPTGLDATSGAHAACVSADITISFGTFKRGTLTARGVCGKIVVVDIGLGCVTADVPPLVDAPYVDANTPAISASAHKGNRGKLAIIAGAAGMGGAAILAAEGALRSGIGLVKVVTAPQHVGAINSRLPEALTAPLADAVTSVTNWADAVLVGPGLGHDDSARTLVRNVLRQWRGAVVVDADALNVFDGDIAQLAELLVGRPALITPHPAELARLVSRDVTDVLAERFDIGVDVARRLGATVLLKGTPTVISAPDGKRHVVAAGTPVLATGGSGDALGGMIATLMAQHCTPAVAAACGAWVHGRAAELTPGVRGFALPDVLERFPDAWRIGDVLAQTYPILAALPSVV